MAGVESMKAIINSFIVKEGHCPYSLGAQSIARYSNQRGHDVELISTKPQNLESGINIILSSNASVCGLSSNYVTEPFVIEMAKRIKEKKGREMALVIGGPSVTYSSRESKIRQSMADLFVRGDGEEAFYHILEAGVSSVLEGKVKINGVSSKQYEDINLASVDLNRLPSPFPIEFKTDHVYWETVRGCAFGCIFCAHPGQINKFREFPLKKVSQESDYLRIKEFKAIYITDPILGGSKNRSKEVLKMLRKLKGSFITAEYRPEYLDEEVMDLLEDAQIGWLELGLQTTNQNLGYFRRNASSIKEKLVKLSKRKIKYSLDLIVGIPGDTREGFKNSLKFAIEEARPTSLKIFPLRVYDGTVLHQMALNKSWGFDKQTRIISSSDTFAETELLEWMTLGVTSAQLYKFLSENKWFGREDKFRNLEFFIRFAERFGKDMSSEYDSRKMNELWQRNISNI